MNQKSGHIHLSDFCKSNTQVEASELLGCTQAAVSQMLATKRNIYLVFDGDAFKEHYEIKKRKPGTAA